MEEFIFLTILYSILTQNQCFESLTTYFLKYCDNCRVNYEYAYCRLIYHTMHLGLCVKCRCAVLRTMLPITQKARSVAIKFKFHELAFTLLVVKA